MDFLYRGGSCHGARLGVWVSLLQGQVHSFESRNLCCRALAADTPRLRGIFDMSSPTPACPYTPAMCRYHIFLSVTSCPKP